MSRSPAYFLGANSPRGFFSLYSELLPTERAGTVFLLKGGPGCGKSTLMKGVAQWAQSRGLAAERILCSGDPDSLDAVLLPELGAAVADATSPHVMEPRLPGVVERYVDLSACYDFDGLQPLREEISACMKGYPACYTEAYRCLEAAGELREDVRAALLTPQLSQRLARRAKGILRREIRPMPEGQTGTVTRRFLSAMTHKGYMTLHSTVQEDYPRVYVLQDSYGLAHGLLLEVLTGAVEGGYDAVACPDPMAPDRLQHLLLPRLGLAFVSATPARPWPGESLRRIRLDSAADTALLRGGRPRLRFALKLAAALEEEAVASLSRAKQMHDELEQLYHPYVNFSQVDGIAAQIIEIISKISR